MKTITTLIFLFAATLCHAQLKPVEQASTLKFTIKNLGFDVDGSFSGFEGSINFDPQGLAVSTFDVSINASTVNTDNSLRDEHLKGSSFFDVKNFPVIRLASTKILPTNKSDTYMLNGQLTIKGKTQPITFPFSANATADGYVFKGSFKIKRKDFGVGGTSTVSDELEVMINVTAKKDHPAA
ncbi:YceI family protein [Mucilaginibacter corticis]|uniref:YceI family protein n=1 Tax=Mucilaginibacter corticis TaxID=2597670 RepID=A0A556MW92_9SPHI|nr:YceI family protein [Mucilaginibacter corticis]TSJ44078.1 YceI family protein [Mucilaginibacter corticis]